MPHSYTLDNQTSIILCSTHRQVMDNTRIVADHGRAPGGQWRCLVCSMQRRLTGELVEPISIDVRGAYVITRFPDGVTMCTCPSWKFQRVAPVHRVCKHIADLEPKTTQGVAR